MGEFVEGVRRLVESEDPVYRERRIGNYEIIEDFRKRSGISDVEMGEFCIDFLSWKLSEYLVNDSVDLDGFIDSKRSEFLALMNS